MMFNIYRPLCRNKQSQEWIPLYCHKQKMLETLDYTKKSQYTQHINSCQCLGGLLIFWLVLAGD